MNWLLVICPLGFILLLAFFLFVSINIWKTYRTLDWKQAAIFSTAFFFIAGSLSLAPELTTRSTLTAFWSIVSETETGGRQSTIRVARNTVSNSFTGRGIDSKGKFKLVGQFYKPDRIEFNKLYSFKKGAPQTIVTTRGRVQNKNGRAFVIGENLWILPDDSPWQHRKNALIAKDHFVGDLGSYENFQRFFAQY